MLDLPGAAYYRAIEALQPLVVVSVFDNKSLFDERPMDDVFSEPVSALKPAAAATSVSLLFDRSVGLRHAGVRVYIK